MRRRQFLKFGPVGMGLIAGCPEQGGEPSQTEVVTGTTEISPSTGPESMKMDLPWDQLPGPFAGPVGDISISRANPEWVYVANEAGYHYSSNGGKEWTHGPRYFHHARNVWASPHDPHVAYSPTDRTDDGGLTWDSEKDGELILPQDQGQRKIYEIEFDPHDSSRVYAATGNGFFRSLDDGQEWNQYEVGVDDEQLWAITVHPDETGELYAGLPQEGQEGIARSEDYGETWSLVSGTEDLPPVWTLIFGEPNPWTLYCLTNGGVYRIRADSILEITSQLPKFEFPWRRRASALSLSANGERLYFVARPVSSKNYIEDPFTLYAYDTTNQNLESLETPENPQTVETHPFQSSRLYLGGISWVYESRDNGNSWTKRPTGFINTGLVTTAVHPERPELILAGTECSAGTFVSHDRGETWAQKRSGVRNFVGDFGEHYLMHVETNGEHIYATTLSGLSISEDSGETWRLLDNEFSGEEGYHLHGLAVHPNDPETVYVGTGKRGRLGDGEDYFDGTFVWKSEDGGSTWTEMTNGFPTEQKVVIQHILISQHDPDVIYIGTYGNDYGLMFAHDVSPEDALGIYKSENGGQRWNSLSTPFTNAFAMGIDGQNPELILATSPKGVFKSSDGGKSWKNTLERNSLALTTHPTVPGLVFAGVQEGKRYWSTFVSQDGGETWAHADLRFRFTRQKGDLEPNTIVPYPERGEIVWFGIDAHNHYLYAATNGAGLWRADITDLAS